MEEPGRAEWGPEGVAAASQGPAASLRAVGARGSFIWHGRATGRHGWASRGGQIRCVTAIAAT
jgi:hypothetical protein